MVKKERILWKNKSKDEALEKISSLYSDCKQTECPVNNLKKFLELLTLESCGECVICREGLYQLYVQCSNISQGLSSEDDFEIMQEISDTMSHVARCDFGCQAGNLIRQEMEKHSEVFLKHIKRKRCDARICEKLSDFVEIVPQSGGGIMAGRRRRRRSE